MSLFVDSGGKPRLWSYWVSFVVVECLIVFFSFRLLFFGWNVAQRVFGGFLLFIAVFGVVFLFFGEWIMGQVNSVIYR